MLQDAYGGFNSSRLVDDFVYYADAVFSHLGRFVKTWITFNEPLVTCDLGFKAGGYRRAWVGEFGVVVGGVCVGEAHRLATHTATRQAHMASPGGGGCYTLMLLIREQYLSC